MDTTPKTGFLTKQSAEEIEQQCVAAARKAVDRLEETPNIDVVDVSTVNLSERYSNYPDSAPLGVAFSLVGSAIDNMMNSNQLMTAISAELIGDCPPASWVRIGQYQTGYYVTYGLIGDSVSAFQCREPDYGSDLLEWGEHFCL